MKYLFSIVLAFLINIFASYSQPTIEIQSDDYNCPSKMYVSDMLTLSDGSTVLVRSAYKSKDAPIIERFDKDLARTYSVPLVLKYKNKELDYYGIIKLDDEIYVICGFENKKDLTTYYFAQHVDKESLKLDNTYIKVIESHNDQENKFTWSRFNYVYSPDSTKILFYLDNFNMLNRLSATKNTKEKLTFSVFDTKLKELYSVEKVLEVIPSKFHILQYEFVGDNVCLLAKEYINLGRDIVNEKINIFYRVIILDSMGNILNEEIISPPDKLVRDLCLVTDKENNIICAGYYSNSGIVAIHGSYFMKINGLTLKKETEFTNAYSDEFLYQRMSKTEMGQFKKFGEEINYNVHRVNKVLPLINGNTLMIHEQFTTEVGGSGGNYHIYSFINVICLDPEGKMLWGQKIPRYQYLGTIPQAWGSCLFMTEDDVYYLVFDDHKKNVNADGTSNLSRFFQEGQGSVQFASISSDGKDYLKAQMMSLEEIGTLISPTYSKAFSNNNRIACCFGNGRYKLCRLKIK